MALAKSLADWGPNAQFPIESGVEVTENQTNRKSKSRILDFDFDNQSDSDLENRKIENQDSKNRFSQIEKSEIEKSKIENQFSENENQKSKIDSCEKCGSTSLWLAHGNPEPLCEKCTPPPSEKWVLERIGPRADLERVLLFSYIVLYGQPACPYCKCSWIVETESGNACWTCKRTISVDELATMLAKPRPAYRRKFGGGGRDENPPLAGISNDELEFDGDE